MSSSASISLDAVDVVDTNDSIERCVCYAHDSAEASMREGRRGVISAWDNETRGLRFNYK